MRLRILLLALLSAAIAFSAQPAQWPTITRDARPWSYWWWMGSAVDPANLTRELEQLRAAGWGGVHIIPIYGAKGYEARYIDYLSPRWMEMLSYTLREASRLGLGVDMTIGSGWCFGGPNIGPEHASVRVVPRQDAGGRWQVSTKLAAPVDRAAPGGEGPMLNPLQGAAIRHYLERFTSAFQGFSGPSLRAFYHDSFEYEANWSPDLLAEFERRRGYRLQDEYQSLFGEQAGDRASRVKADYRETLSDLMVENFNPVWMRWARAHGAQVRNQAHGSPANLLDLYAGAEIPETEMFREDRSTLVSQFASSAGHIMGRKLIASETGTWMQEHFQETLASLKDLVLQLFLSGVNHVIYHGTCYSPAEAPWPGWVFYASTQMNARNPIWRDVPAFNDWLARSQAMLQQGASDNDILLYWPVHDVWSSPQGLQINFGVDGRAWLAGRPFGAFAQRLSGRGWTFDLISDRLLEQVSVSGRALTANGTAWRVLLVPACERMPVPTLRRILHLAASGATVVIDGNMPVDVPGLAALENRRSELRQLIQGVNFGPAGTDGVRLATLGKGRILMGPAEAALGRAALQRESMVDHEGIHFVRRVNGDEPQYLVANRGGREYAGWLPLARTARQVVVMDPLSGAAGAGATRQAAKGTQVFVQLNPGEAVFLRLLHGRDARLAAWTYRRPGARRIEVNGPWQVSFLAGGPLLPAEKTISGPASWTTFSGDAGLEFAGTARYRTTFDAPAGPWFLDLGEVRESARVVLNGKPLATLFAPPFRVYAGSLKPRGNRLEVEVTNLAANRIRAMDRNRTPWKLFHNINFVNQHYKPFDAYGWPVFDSGLLGPVRLVEATAVQPAPPGGR